MSIRIFENIPAYRRTRDGYAFTVIKIEISQNSPRHGKCCACVAYHRDHNEGVPGCFFSKEAEATYDRSIKALAKDHGII